MSDEDLNDLITKLKKDRDHWKQLAEQQGVTLAEMAWEIERLQDLLAIQQVNDVTESHELLRKLADEKEVWHQRALDTLEEVFSLAERYGILEGLINPERFGLTEDEIKRRYLEQHNPVSYERMTELLSRALEVAYVMVYRTPDGSIFMGQEQAVYFGTAEEFNEDWKRVYAIAWRAPMLEDLRGPFLEAFGITAQQQLAAIQRISIFWIDTELRKRFDARFDLVFIYYIEPHCKPEDIDIVRQRFLQSVKATCRSMAKYRKIPGDAPSSRRGRPRRK